MCHFYEKSVHLKHHQVFLEPKQPIVLHWETEAYQEDSLFICHVVLPCELHQPLNAKMH